MIRRRALTATTTVALVLGAGAAPSAATAASAPAAAKRAALAFQHAFGKGQTARACAMLTSAAVKSVVQQAEKPASTSCAAALPAYRKRIASYDISATKLRRATYRSATGAGRTWLVETSAASTGVTRAGGAWKVSTPIALG